jgi:hypothetical protein
LQKNNNQLKQLNHEKSNHPTNNHRSYVDLLREVMLSIQHQDNHRVEVQRIDRYHLRQEVRSNGTTGEEGG